MNQIGPEPEIPGLAKIVYGDGEYHVMKQGAFVLCAVTGQRIMLDDLRYWSVPRQEAYVDAEAATERLEVLTRKEQP